MHDLEPMLTSRCVRVCVCVCMCVCVCVCVCVHCARFVLTPLVYDPSTILCRIVYLICIGNNQFQCGIVYLLVCFV